MSEREREKERDRQRQKTQRERERGGDTDPTHVEDLETSDVEHTNEELPLVLGVQGPVDTLDQPGEHTVVEGLGQGGHGVGHLVDVTALGHVLAADLDLWLEQTLQQITSVDAQHEGDLLSLWRWQRERGMTVR